jgi:hypothetical protein
MNGSLNGISQINGQAASSLMIILFIFISLHLCAQPSDAWISLFNGEDLTGWSVVDKPARVTVKEGNMILQMTPYTSRHAFVRTTKKYRNFIFEVEFRRDAHLDSGILFRCESTADSAFSALFGYMMKIDPSPTRLWTGGIFLDFGNGINWLHTLEGDDRARHALKENNEWNHVRIEAMGEVIKIWLNGIPTVHLRDDKYRKGFIAFKIHYLMQESELKKNKIAFRNVRIMTRNIQKFLTPTDLPLRDTRDKKEITYFR